ncbi:MAG: hypothetical protein MI861_07100 [Pirellulales bacterium]|nr:hypothetical protein [Pirellulales bacterium]
MEQVDSIFSADVGLEQISTYSDPGSINLPDAAQFTPGQAGFARELVALLYPPSIEQSLLDSLRPELDDPRVLNPIEFHAALDASLDQLDRRITQDPAGADSAALRDALDELQEERELREQLQVHRQLLIKA